MSDTVLFQPLTCLLSDEQL